MISPAPSRTTCATLKRGISKLPDRPALRLSAEQSVEGSMRVASGPADQRRQLRADLVESAVRGPRAMAHGIGRQHHALQAQFRQEYLAHLHRLRADNAYA